MARTSLPRGADQNDTTPTTTTSTTTRRRMSSYCSSEGGFSDSLMSSPRKNSFLQCASEDNEVDHEVHELLEAFRVSHPDLDRLAEVDAALEHCRHKLKELLRSGDEQNPDGDVATLEEIGESGVDVNDNGGPAKEADSHVKPLLVAKHNSERKQMYFDKIVQLGLERQTIGENSKSAKDSTLRAMGHEFVLQPTRGRHNPCCEVCMHTIWRLVQSWRRCRVCGLRAHEKCTEQTRRVCSGLLASRSDFALNTNICEEQTLAEQDYKCAECAAPICYDGPSEQEARLCDYSGELFCPNCHWMDTWSIPARIIHNLDASPRPICRAVKQLLCVVDKRPLINIDESYVSLIKFHKEIRRVSELRRNFLLMKCYFVSCREASKIRILQYLNQHSHFVDSADMYSIKELRDLCNGTLLPELEGIFAVFQKHIEEDCEACRGNGFFCELCDEGDKDREKVLYPFTEGTKLCATCCAVFHRRCFEKRSFHCPRCERRKRRSAVERIPSDEGETAPEG